MIMKRTVSVAPMMDLTNSYCRNFLRLISRHTLMYTEMVTTGAIIHGDRDRFLRFDSAEHPIALQLGGSDPIALAECAKIATDYAYDEINLNVGCPSDRVQSGRFGACLMAEPELVANCVAAMQDATPIPVTVKTRLGIDDMDSYEELCQFIETVKKTGCHTFILHARKAWLKGLSPKQNRDIPPLQYDRVYQIKQDYPQLEILINGGITTLDEVATHITKTDGVMIGREAYQNPYLLAEVDQRFYSSTESIPDRLDIIRSFIEYADRKIAEGKHVKNFTRHILGLFQGQPGAKKWRRHLSENAHLPDANTQVIKDALNSMDLSL